ncbi:hypothetical protein [Streptomyces scopuliridis]|uniref:hypothetical protein n=1 Tax=Streptomyces scopuliridis TaxID=452529 RepID=UPI0036C9BC6E
MRQAGAERKQAASQRIRRRLFGVAVDYTATAARPAIDARRPDRAADAHSDAKADEFNQRFAWFVAIAYDGEEAVGFAYGAPENARRKWWREHLDTAPEQDRTLPCSELAVSPKWGKRGVAERALS